MPKMAKMTGKGDGARRHIYKIDEIINLNMAAKP